MTIFLNLVVLCLLIGLGKAQELPEVTGERYKCLFDEYSVLFGHEYNTINEYEKAFTNFIKNLRRLNVSYAENISHLADMVTWKEEQVSYGLNPVLHKDIMPSTLLRDRSKYIIKFDTRWQRALRLLTKLIRKRVAEDSCVTGTQVVYVRPNPLPILSNLPPSVDFRELGLVDRARDQGMCGCSWAMASAGLFEATIRSTREYFKNLVTVDDVFKDPQFNASEQYFMNKSFYGINSCCQGGNYLFLSLDLANNPQMDTVESLTNFPFTMKEAYENPDPIERDFSRKVVNPFLPGNYAVVSSCKTSLVYVYDALSPSWTFGKATKIMKSLLAQGIPVVATLHISSLGDEYLKKIMMYRRGILDIPCKLDAKVVDHQVLIIGYGTYDGVDVWVVRNSWGDLWGSHGHFYVSIGNNSMCIEHTLYTEIPAYFPSTGSDASKPYAQRKPADSSTICSGVLERGDEDSLDPDPDPTPSNPLTKQKTFITVIASCTIVALAVILLIVITTMAILSKRRRAIRPSSPTESQIPTSFVSIRKES